MTTIRDKIAAIKAKVSIVDLLALKGIIVSHDVETQIKCIAHDDNRPSARVYPQSNSLFCWTCHKAFDVISATQIMWEIKDFKEAVDNLVEFFHIDVESGPVQINKFYQHAHEYRFGDNFKISNFMQRVGEDFRKAYARIQGYTFIQHYIDHLWAEYDEIYINPATPKERYDAVLSWYENALYMLKSNEQMCKDLFELKQKATAAGYK